MDFGIQNNVKAPLSLGGLSSGAPAPVQLNHQQQQQPPNNSYAPPPNQNYNNNQNQNNQGYQAPPQQNRPPATGVSLKKGQKVSLTKMNSALDNILVGLGWDMTNNSNPCDLDVEVFMLDSNDRIVGDDWFVFYNQLASPDGSVLHSGDNRTGMGTGDDEVINVQLSRVDQRVNKLLFIVTINEAKEKGHNFGQMQNAYIRIVDKSSNNELVRFNLTDYYTNVISMMVGEIYRHNSEWKFNPVGEGLDNDLYGLCARFGVGVQS